MSRLAEIVATNTPSGEDPEKVRRRILALWRFEDLMKETFANFVKIVVDLGNDPLEETRSRTLHTLYSLLLNNPEQEKVSLVKILSVFSSFNIRINFIWKPILTYINLPNNSILSVL